MIRMATVVGISGPVVKSEVSFSVHMYEVSYVGTARLLGEVIRVRGNEVDIQVYENTDGLSIGEPVELIGSLFSVELGPGLLGSVLDGIGRPLSVLGEDSIYLRRGEHISALDRQKKWHFKPLLSIETEVMGGTVLGEVAEGTYITHKIMVPPKTALCRLKEISPEGNYTVNEPIAVLDDGTSLFLKQSWVVRQSRPTSKRLSFDRPLLTGQRIIDTLFPVALGGAAVLPGGFGTGKTVTQQSIAKWCNADIIIYIGCGERGNEMTEVLEEFPQLMDPYHDAPLMERMVLIANTSNMPVAAREASVYLGMTIGEYFRDMGYDVAIMADSTSRWAEAMREIGGRLEEMPGEEGYPAYLGARLAQYYERAGRTVSCGLPERSGSVTVINAVSPAGGDFSEPVTQASLRLSGGFWALDKRLAQQRHFPAINWNQSYTLYEESLASFYVAEVGGDWEDGRRYIKGLMAREKVLRGMVQLVGRDGLSEEDKWILEQVELIKIIYFQQNAFDISDASCSLQKQKELMLLLQKLDMLVRERIASGVTFDQIRTLPINAELLAIREMREDKIKELGSSWLEKLKIKMDAFTVVVPL